MSRNLNNRQDRYSVRGVVSATHIIIIILLVKQPMLYQDSSNRHPRCARNSEDIYK